MSKPTYYQQTNPWDQHWLDKDHAVLPLEPHSWDFRSRTETLQDHTAPPPTSRRPAFRKFDI